MPPKKKTTTPGSDTPKQGDSNKTPPTRKKKGHESDQQPSPKSEQASELRQLPSLSSGQVTKLGQQPPLTSGQVTKSGQQPPLTSGQAYELGQQTSPTPKTAVTMLSLQLSFSKRKKDSMPSPHHHPPRQVAYESGGVRIHAINVGQGDCILVEFYNLTDEDEKSCYLIDGGKGRKITRQISNNPANDRNEQHTKNKLDCLRKYQCPDKLKGIIITHPDDDHYQGIAKLLEWFGPSFRGDILITEAFIKVKRNAKLTELMTQVCHNHVVVNPSVQTSYSFEDNHLTCHFNKANGILYQVQEERGIQAASPKPQQGLPDDNLTSVITDIDGFSIVLTGDSCGDVVTGKLDLTGKKVKIFQVPHHGSNKNSTLEFYESFEADVYLISGGGHDGHDHPNTEVLQGIIRTNTNRKTRCIIVVTNSYGLKSSKLRGLPDQWWEWVTIYHTDDLVHYRDEANADRRSNQWITLNPAHCPHVLEPLDTQSQQDRQLIPLDDNVLVEWSPRGYIEMIKRKIETHCETETTKPMYPFYYKKKVSIQNVTAQEIHVDGCIIIAVPAPHEPWKGHQSLNLHYVQESTLDQDRVTFLEPLTGTTTIERQHNFRQYAYSNNQKHWHREEINASVKVT